MKYIFSYWTKEDYYSLKYPNKFCRWLNIFPKLVKRKVGIRKGICTENIHKEDFDYYVKGIKLMDENAEMFQLQIAEHPTFYISTTEVL